MTMKSDVNWWTMMMITIVLATVCLMSAAKTLPLTLFLSSWKCIAQWWHQRDDENHQKWRFPIFCCCQKLDITENTFQFQNSLLSSARWLWMCTAPQWPQTTSPGVWLMIIIDHDIFVWHMMIIVLTWKNYDNRRNDRNCIWKHLSDHKQHLQVLDCDLWW